jgi:sorbitol-specific phosphotransferase system component IIBC
MAPSAGQIIGFMVALLVIGVLLPVGLTDILEFSSTNATIETLVTTILPIMAVVGLVIAFVPKGED